MTTQGRFVFSEPNKIPGTPDIALPPLTTGVVWIVGADDVLPSTNSL